MAEIIKRKKALSVSPLKSSAPIGASLAFAGINRSMPMMHGSQGCTAFGKVFFVRHFREPIPLQTTAMDQVSTVLGADESIIEGLKTIAEKNKPALIGVPTTGLSETQGCDVHGSIKEFYKRYPEYTSIKVVGVNTPDFTGSMESGFAAALHAMIDKLVPARADAGTSPGKRKKQVNILASSMLTPGDLEVIKEYVECFGLRPLVVPDIGDSLDGHLGTDHLSPLTIGGTSVSEFETMGDAVASISIGNSVKKAGDLLESRTEVKNYHFDQLLMLEDIDKLVALLSQLSHKAVPERLRRQRSQLQDAMLDCHFMLGFSSFAIAADPDLLYSFSCLVNSVGGSVAVAVAPTKAPILQHVFADTVKIGDLEDMEKMAKEKTVDMVLGNSHAVASSQRMNVPILRIGFPQYDLIGGYQRTWIGYRGVRQALFDLANIMSSLEKGEIEPYVSKYAQKMD
ncbi:MAG: nitrogenase iron-molybdenum cofactor biosynthesis protein NifN [Gammaproteobacteria bacterium]|nr:nitrogenase iron-molybdenum cofactor biosynthesis protein NifN [Gammaproteobacteria bacterium]